MEVDYSLYLVTDSLMVPTSATFLGQIKKAIDNGVTLVQLREKSLSTLDFISRASSVHELTKQKGIPLIINDRLDVALAIDAEGVHVGQDDMPALLARKLLGPNKILGVTCSTPDEVDAACREGVADYLGLGTVFKTNTKKDVTDPDGVGPIGIRKMLQVLKNYNMKAGHKIKCVAIGGINETNASRVLYQTAIPGQSLDGLAVVSCIMAQEDAAASTIRLCTSINSPPPWYSSCFNSKENDDSLRQRIKRMTSESPLVHHITNDVVKNFSANVTLAIGASPIMSELPEEFEDFTCHISNLALLLNLGTPDETKMDMFRHALRVYNSYGKPVVFDPVAVGASGARMRCCKDILNSGYVTVIKGNVGEILTLRKLTSMYTPMKESSLKAMRGVDSVACLSDDEIIRLGKDVAVDFRAVIVITGVINYVIDGTFNSENYIYDIPYDKEPDVTKIPGGHALMGCITGTGCSLGSTIAAFIASDSKKIKNGDNNLFHSVVDAIKLYNISGRRAGETSKRPGSFMVNFLDVLYSETHEDISGKEST